MLSRKLTTKPKRPKDNQDILTCYLKLIDSSIEDTGAAHLADQLPVKHTIFTCGDGLVTATTSNAIVTAYNDLCSSVR